jgi:predicted NBD/HSP70 family sugar kinase
MKYTIGVDIGATKIIAGLIKGTKVICKKRFDTQTDQIGKKGILNNIRLAIESVWDPRVEGIGIGIAGTTNFKDGIFYNNANFPKSFRNIDLRQELKNFHVPVIIDNDVHCFALGEALYGVGKKYENVFGLTLGTGVGGSLIISKQIFRGRNNAAGEVGHMTIAMNDREATCGRYFYGHLEAYASGTGLRRLIEKNFKETIQPEDLERLAASGDKKAAEIIKIAGHALAVGCSNIVQILNPDVIVVGGGLSQMKSLWKILRNDFPSLIQYPQLRSTKIIKSVLLHEATLLGAVSQL